MTKINLLLPVLLCWSLSGQAKEVSLASQENNHQQSAVSNQQQIQNQKIIFTDLQKLQELNEKYSQEIKLSVNHYYVFTDVIAAMMEDKEAYKEKNNDWVYNPDRLWKPLFKATASYKKELKQVTLKSKEGQTVKGLLFNYMNEYEIAITQTYNVLRSLKKDGLMIYQSHQSTEKKELKFKELENKFTDQLDKIDGNFSKNSKSMKDTIKLKLNYLVKTFPNEPFKEIWFSFPNL